MRTRRVLINVHGLYGSSGDQGSKSALLGAAVKKRGLAHVVQYSSSRNWEIFESGNGAAELESFRNKTFEQEIDDLRLTLDLLVLQRKLLFGLNGKYPQFIVVGNSLGGTIATALGVDFQHIEKIVLCGSGTGAATSKRPVLSTCPPKSELIESARLFRGDVLLLQGSEDSVVPLEAGDELLSYFVNARSVQKRVIEGANHQFNSLVGKNGGRAERLYVESILEFLGKSS